MTTHHPACPPPPAGSRQMTGFWALLTDEQKAAARTYRGPENIGDPNFPKRPPVTREEDR